MGGERRERRRGGLGKEYRRNFSIISFMHVCLRVQRERGEIIPDGKCAEWASVRWMQNNGLEGGEKKDENVQLTDIGAFYRAWKIVREANLINLYESLYHCYRVSRTGIPLFGSFFFFLAREKKRRRKLGPI